MFLKWQTTIKSFRSECLKIQAKKTLWRVLIQLETNDWNVSVTKMSQQKWPKCFSENKNIFIVHVSRKRKEWVIGGFCWFVWSWLFWNTRVFFWLGPMTSTLKIMWTFSWFSESNFKTVVFQRAWFSWFYDVSLVSRFVFCANTTAHLCLQYVLRSKLRHWLAVQGDWS